jgi:hypothetical protein
MAVPSTSGPGVRGFKAEMDGLRERMRGLGFSYGEIAAEVSRRYRVRPREAYRMAWGLSLTQAAERFNDRAGREGTDPEGRAGMTGAHLCEMEKWPRSERKPSVYVLCLLACVYDTDVLCLLDLVDHESLPRQDRLILLGRRRAETAGTAQQGAPQPGQQAAYWQGVISEGMTLTLPYVPARLVIEVSGPAGNAGWLADGRDAAEAVHGRLALVRDGSPSPARIGTAAR